MFSKCHFLVLKIKRNIFTLVFLAFGASLLLFSSSNLPAIKKGLSLWANSVVPALFPFFVATELLMNTNFVTILGRFLNKYISEQSMQKLSGILFLIFGFIGLWSYRIGV